MCSLRPIPQTDPTGSSFRILSLVVLSNNKKTPEFFFAILLATFARVLVGATPIDTGIPVHLAILSLYLINLFSISDKFSEEKETNASSIE